MDKPLLIDRNAALKSQDSPYQTYRCRYYNPNICKDNGMKNIFTNDNDKVLLTTFTRNLAADIKET